MVKQQDLSCGMSTTNEEQANLISYKISKLLNEIRVEKANKKIQSDLGALTTAVKMIFKTQLETAEKHEVSMANLMTHSKGVSETLML